MSTTNPMLYRCLKCRAEESHPHQFAPRYCPTDGALMIIDIGPTRAMQQGGKGGATADAFGVGE